MSKRKSPTEKNPTEKSPTEKSPTEKSPAVPHKYQQQFDLTQSLENSLREHLLNIAMVAGLACEFRTFISIYSSYQ